ncbi:MAG: TetR family transcriptional regulator [Rhodoglobus sp.]|nr:TetR family transcriptional regulator [Rhodoglobus sp.]
MARMTIDGRRARGETSRRAIMNRAVHIASVDGLGGLSIGGLATEASMSKGGIVALFGTKEQLQLATIAAAADIFRESVVLPGLAVEGGLTRLRALTDAWLAYSENRVFAGGCFFAAANAEFGSRQGPVRDAIAASMTEWQEFLHGTIERAVARGELPAHTDAGQLTFEITSVLDGANSTSLLFGSSEPYARARVAIEKLLAQSS